MQLGNTRITVEELTERTKITFPKARNNLALFAYTVLVFIWLLGLLLFLYYLVRPPAPREIGDLPGMIRCAWFFGVLIWILVWVRMLGRRLLRWWQFNLADKEVLFFDDTAMILRRPVSIFGLTEAYDRQHMAPFYYEEVNEAIGFRYGNAQHHLFGLGLPKDEQDTAIEYLNHRFFPNYEEDEELEL